jgi:hypothetical protein
MIAVVLLAFGTVLFTGGVKEKGSRIEKDFDTISSVSRPSATSSSSVLLSWSLSPGALPAQENADLLNDL